MMRRIASGVWLRVDKRLSVNILGANPSIGGSPPRDNMRMEMVKSSFRVG